MAWRHRLMDAGQQGLNDLNDQGSCLQRDGGVDVLFASSSEQQSSSAAGSAASFAELARDGAVMTPCESSGWQDVAAAAGHALGTARFGRDRGSTGHAATCSGCFLLLHKPEDSTDQETTFLPKLDRTSQRLVLASFKNRGASGSDIRTAGIRLGNALCLVAAGMTLALDNAMDFRMSVSEQWKDYFVEEDGIFSRMPTSLWYHRSTDMDAVFGSPDLARYEELPMRPGLNSVVMHGYFQNPRYFLHRLGEVRRFLSPPSLVRRARIVWSRFIEQASLEEDALSKAAYVAVHVRLGDSVGRWSGESFYTAAIDVAKQQLRRQKSVERALCVIFSDSSEDHKLQALADRMGCDRGLVFQGAVRDDVAMMVMAHCCEAIVISASTFSSWAAVLGRYRIVVAPQTLGTECAPDVMNFTLGAMPGWTRLPVPCADATVAGEPPK
eukprot:TRINITY_DN30683_c0_g1_i2.p1 TRINITY_DN30683_c0_g1~~TRINITY_DN30683_c0_g1_i2.p1  ORF type:complete len:440 (-),score=86.42 TRINITY_DN30683_c0_g1_i2:8-1327(-)